MNTSQKLTLVKSIHTAIWVFFNLVLIYLYYAVLTDQVGFLFWIGIGLFGLEMLVLLLYRWHCPLTFVARRYSDSPMDNFDIYLPLWLARHNKSIYSALLLSLLVLYLIKFVI